MNFNLVSPSDNGSEFTIKFNDHITIEPNSTVRLNYVELVRNKEVILNDTATLTMNVEPSDCYPNVVPATLVANKVFLDQTSSSDSETIAKGTYTFLEFKNAVQTALTNILSRSTLEVAYETYLLNDPNEATLLISINPKSTTTTALTDFGISATHAHDAQDTDALGNKIAYRTTNTAGAYDNYALSLIHYEHYCGNSGASNEFSFDEKLSINTEYNSYAYFESEQIIQAQVGDLFVGLYSDEYADGINTPPTRTNGNNPPVVVDGVPACFYGIECKATGEMVVYIAQRADGNTANTWTTLNEGITGMVVVARIPPTTFSPTDKWRFLVGTEIDNESDSPQIRIKIGNYQGAEFVTVFDSGLANRRNLPHAFMVGTGGITYDSAVAVNSQVPFGWLLSVKSTDATDGFDVVKYRGFDKDQADYGAGIIDNTNPATLAKKIKLTFSSEASRALGTSDSLIIRPNQFAESQKHPVLADLDYTWKANNYSIFCDLPLRNFKNKNGTARSAENSANKKFVLANIPSAFATGEVIQSTQDALGNGEIISVYQPYQPIISHLNNNQIQTNNLSFNIVDMLSEEKATEIKRSVINFTIDPHPKKMNEM